MSIHIFVFKVVNLIFKIIDVNFILSLNSSAHLYILSKQNTEILINTVVEIELDERHNGRISIGKPRYNLNEEIASLSDFAWSNTQSVWRYLEYPMKSLLLFIVIDRAYFLDLLRLQI